MPKTLPTGALVPATTDGDDVPRDLTAYDRTVLRPIRVSSRTAGEQKRVALNAAGWVGPVMVLIEPDRTILLHPNTGAAGEAWEYVGGPQHGHEAQWSHGGSIAGQGVDLNLSNVYLESSGWAVKTLQYGHAIVVPEDGEYAICTNAGISVGDADVDAGRLGRTIIVGFANASEILRHGATAHAKWSATSVRDLRRGMELSFNARFTSPMPGSTVSGFGSGTLVRWDVRIDVVQIAKPRWK